MLEDDGLKIHNAIAIMNYICRKYGKYDLIGLTPQGTVLVASFRLKSKKLSSSMNPTRNAS